MRAPDRSASQGHGLNTKAWLSWVRNPSAKEPGLLSTRASFPGTRGPREIWHVGEHTGGIGGEGRRREGEPARSRCAEWRPRLCSVDSHSNSRDLCACATVQLKRRYGALPNQKELMQRRLRGDASAQAKKCAHPALLWHAAHGAAPHAHLFTCIDMFAHGLIGVVAPLRQAFRLRRLVHE